jgi:P22 coat protein - gene protein 5
MANTILTPTKVTRKALMILHQKLAFIGTIERQYDEQFAKEGAKIGSTLQIRLPNKYVSATGAAITPQDTSENSVALAVGTQRNVPMQFFTSELTLSLDDFSDRIIDPAMAVLAAATESDAFAMAQDVYQQVGAPATIPNALLTYLQAMARLDNSLAPKTQRCIQLPPLDAATIIDALKGLFHDQTAISKQYRDGIMGRTSGFDWYNNTLVSRITNGNKVAAVTVSGAGQTGASITLGGLAGADTFKKGEVMTFAGCNEVHPETKVDTGRLQKFVVTADATSAGATLAVSISPSIVVTGALQNVSASPTNGGAVTVDGTASLVYGVSLGYFKQAFAIAFADLYMPKGLDFGAREVMDGISLRIIRDYDILTDKIYTRCDVLYGYKTIRPELACRVASA